MEQPKRKHGWKEYTYIGIPALFDMAATTIMSYGLLYIDVSVMQMLRGAMIIFASCFNIWCLKRKIKKYQWVSVIGTVLALICVGISAIMGSFSDSTGQPWNK